MDHGIWFRDNDVEGLRILMSAHNGPEALRKAEDAINKADENIKAQARRACLFLVDTPLKRAGAETASTHEGNAAWESDQMNMANLPEPDASM